jgi:hypothetical protein
MKKNLKLDDAKTISKEVVTKRRPQNPPDTSKITNATTAESAWDAFQTLLNTTNPPGGGTCDYMVNGQPFTATNITKAECDALGGEFH